MGNRVVLCVLVPEEGWEGQEGVQVNVVSAPHPHAPLPFPAQAYTLSWSGQQPVLFLPHLSLPGPQGYFLGLPFPWIGGESSRWPHIPQRPISLGPGLQHPLAFALSFGRWLCIHPELYRLPVLLSSVGPLAPGDLIAKGSLVSDCVSVEWAGPRSSRFP